MKKLVLLCSMFLFMLQILAPQARGSEVDILVEKLVKKGILTRGDAQEIIKEVKDAAWQEKDKERAEIIKGAKDAIKRESPTLFAGEIPAWVRKMKLKGDLRLRYESTERDDTPDRHRGRYRLRFGVVTNINDQVEVGFGLASGDDKNPRSTNDSFNNSFEKGDLFIDYAYASYKPASWVTLIGGKFANPLFMPSDLLFDTDIRPEGASALFNYPATPFVDLFMNTGFWIIDERSTDENDPTMYVVQPGAKFKLGSSAYLKTAAAMYQFDNVENTTLDYTSRSNTLKKFKNTLEEDYDATALSGELGFKTPLARMPFVALFGDWVNNNSASGDDTGYLYGMKFGMDKVAKRHDWQFMARYERLERDAWPDAFPDSDTYDGETNIKGYKLVFSYGLFDNIDFTTAYFNTRKITGDSLDEEKLQLDLNFKF